MEKDKELELYEHNKKVHQKLQKNVEVKENNRNHLLKTEEEIESVLKKSTLGVKIKQELEQLLKEVKNKIQETETKRNEDLYQILKYVMDRLTMTWEDKYALAKAYYEHYKNLDISRDFKTINGYERNEKGINLGSWIQLQRVSYNEGKLSKERIQLLAEIKINWNPREKNWQKYYELAKVYYEHHKNLDIPQNFKTKNGYEYDKYGEKLGIWLKNQRVSYKEGKLSQERIKLLEGIKIEWDSHEKDWQENYKLAKAYYEHHKNLDIPQNFKTKNGYEYDAKGENLGIWLSTQRAFYKEGRLSQERIKLLEEIKINWNMREKTWPEYYELAKAYYEHHKNLDIPVDFKTKNGYEKDEEGENLGDWLQRQRVSYKKGKLNKEKIQLLEKIKIEWDPHERDWQENYKLAKAYYEYHHNLNIPFDFKTKNGYERDAEGENLGIWLNHQRNFYKKGKLSEERIQLLEEIKINWHINNMKITEKNTDGLRKIVLSYLEEVLDETKTIESIEDIEKLNDTFLNHLEERTKRR